MHKERLDLSIRSESWNIGNLAGKAVTYPLGWAGSGFAGLAKGLGHGMYYGGGLDQNEPQNQQLISAQPKPQPQQINPQQLFSNLSARLQTIEKQLSQLKGKG